MNREWRASKCGRQDPQAQAPATGTTHVISTAEQALKRHGICHGQKFREPQDACKTNVTQARKRQLRPVSDARDQHIVAKATKR